MEFPDYLKTKKLNDMTIRYHMRCFRRVCKWSISSGINIDLMTYNDIMQFIKHCNDQGTSVPRTNKFICTTRYYYDFLKLSGKIDHNPFSGLSVKGRIIKLPANLLDGAELDELYKNYCIQLSVHTSRKVMLGFIIYQGIALCELANIRLNHIKVKECKVLIKGTRFTHERVLSLQPQQMPLLCKYLEENNPKDCMFLKSGLKDNDYRKAVDYKTKHIFNQLKRLNPKAYSSQQIRSSAITEWLKKEEIRQVQYMAGLKHISSVERYQVNNIEELHNNIKEFHPMR